MYSVTRVTSCSITPTWEGLPPNPRALPRTAEVRTFASARCLSRTDELREK